MRAEASAELADGVHLREESEDDDASDDEIATGVKSKAAKDSLTYRWTKKEVGLRCFASIQSGLEPAISLKHQSPLETFNYSFTDVFKHLTSETIRYGSLKQHDFLISVEDMKTFVGILLISGYHVLPRCRHYWSEDDDLHCNMVANAMSRNSFDDIFRHIHCADNANLTITDHMAKVRPIMDILNQIFAAAFPMDLNLDLDESMIEYFGRHGCKQTIRNKPVRFGFKAWCLNSPSVYLLQFDLYQGSTVTQTDLE